MNRFKDASIAALIAGTALATTSGLVVASQGSGEEGEDTERGPAPELSMQDVIKQLKDAGAQRVFESELEREDGRPFYEVQYLDKNGQTREAYIDASDGQKLQNEPGEDDEDEEDDEEDDD